MLRRPRPFLLRLALAAFLATVGAAMPATAATDNYWATQAEDVAKSVDTAVETFTKGDAAAAKRGLTEAYFHHFEDSKLEAAIRRFISAKRAAEIEKMFSTMRKAMTANNAAEVKQLAAAMREAITAEAKTLDAEKVTPGVFEVNQ